MEHSAKVSSGNKQRELDTFLEKKGVLGTATSYAVGAKVRKCSAICTCSVYSRNMEPS